MKQYRGYLIDLDGTIYRGKDKIPGAKEFIDYLQATNTPFMFVTNNSTKEPKDVVANLAENFDIHVTEANVFTTALATAAYLDEHATQEKTVYCIGEQGLKKALRQVGFTPEENHPNYVVVGLDYDVTYHKFELATLAVRAGAQFIGTNADTNLPNERGLVPGAGSVIGLVKVATQQEPVMIGKPEKIIMEMALAKMKMTADDVVMVGDNYNTDIKAGLNAQMDTLLVYTGVSTKEQIKQITDPKLLPTHQVDNLADWVAILEADK